MGGADPIPVDRLSSAPAKDSSFARRPGLRSSFLSTLQAARPRGLEGSSGTSDQEHIPSHLDRPLSTILWAEPPREECRLGTYAPNRRYPGGYGSQDSRGDARSNVLQTAVDAQ